MQFTYPQLKEAKRRWSKMATPRNSSNTFKKLKIVTLAASTLSYCSLVVVYSRMLSLLSIYAVGFPLFSFAVEMKGSFDE